MRGLQVMTSGWNEGREIQRRMGVIGKGLRLHRVSADASTTPLCERTAHSDPPRALVFAIPVEGARERDDYGHRPLIWSRPYRLSRASDDDALEVLAAASAKSATP
jgi:hypothetical protein